MSAKYLQQQWRFSHEYIYVLYVLSVKCINKIFNDLTYYFIVFLSFINKKRKGQKIRAHPPWADEALIGLERPEVRNVTPEVSVELFTIQQRKYSYF